MDPKKNFSSQDTKERSSNDANKAPTEPEGTQVRAEPAEQAIEPQDVTTEQVPYGPLTQAEAEANNPCHVIVPSAAQPHITQMGNSRAAGAYLFRFEVNLNDSNRLATQEERYGVLRLLWEIEGDIAVIRDNLSDVVRSLPHVYEQNVYWRARLGDFVHIVNGGAFTLFDYVSGVGDRVRQLISGAQPREEWNYGQVKELSSKLCKYGRGVFILVSAWRAHFPYSCDICSG